MKSGTRIEVKGVDLSGNLIWYPASIRPWMKKVSGSRESMPDWHVVKFDDGEGKLLCHRSGFRVTDNRA